MIGLYQSLNIWTKDICFHWWETSWGFVKFHENNYYYYITIVWHHWGAGLA